MFPSKFEFELSVDTYHLPLSSEVLDCGFGGSCHLGLGELGMRGGGG